MKAAWFLFTLTCAQPMDRALPAPCHPTQLGPFPTRWSCLAVQDRMAGLGLTVVLGCFDAAGTPER